MQIANVDAQVAGLSRLPQRARRAVPLLIVVRSSRWPREWMCPRSALRRRRHNLQG